MNIWNKFFSRKAAPQGIADNQTLMMGMPRREAPERNLDELSKEGYMKVTYVKRCVDLIADGVAGLPLVLYQIKNGEKLKIKDHPLLDLINKPNKIQGRMEFFKEAIANLSNTGNSFMNAVKPFDSKPPTELWNFRPSQVQVISKDSIMPVAYLYRLTNGSHIKFDINPITGESLVMQSKLYNPLDSFYGMSPVSTAALEVDQANEMNVWNYSLLRNGGRPSVAITYGGGAGQMALTEKQRDQIREDITTVYSGASNAGRPFLLENGMDVKELQLSPKEMDFLKNKSVVARDIGNAFGVPPQMLGVEGSQTFANYAQAKLSLYDDAIAPAAKIFITDLNHWLVPMFGEDLLLEVDENAVPALEPRRAAKWDQVNKSEFLTINEKRDMTGFGRYEPTGDPADSIMVSSNEFPLEVAAEMDTETEKEKPPKEDNEDEKGIRYTVIEGKQFNLETEKQKRRAWFEFNRKKIRFEKRMTSQLKGFFKNQIKEIENALIDVPPSLIAFTVDSVIGDTQEDLDAIFKSTAISVYKSFGKDVLKFLKFDTETLEVKQDEIEDQFLQDVLNYAETDGLSGAGDIQGTTRKKMLKEIKEGIAEGESTPEISKRLKEKFNKISPARARTIARTEIHGASNAGSRQAARRINLPGMEKEWVSTIDDRSRDGNPETTNHVVMNGTKTLMDNDFVVWSKDGDDFMDGPGDPKAPIDQRVNCRCTTVYSSRRKR